MKTAEQPAVLSNFSLIEEERGTSRAAVGAIILLLILGTAVRIVPYITARSLWNDEAALAVNIVERSYWELTTPLDHQQAAPTGFLWSVKTSTVFFGSGERSLRLVPLLAGLATLGLGVYAGSLLLPPGGAVSLTAMLAFSRPLIYYSNEIKQYGLDAFWAALLLWLTIRCLKKPKPASIFAWAVGVIFSVWFSHPMVFIIAACGILLGIEFLYRQEKRLFLLTAASCGAAAFSFSVHYFFFTSHLMQGNEYLWEFWGSHIMPDGWTIARLTWFPARIYELCKVPFGSTAAWPCLGLTGLAVFSGWRHNRKLLWLFTGPVILALIAASFRYYPFADRLLLFAMPGLLLLIACTISQLRLESGLDNSRKTWRGVYFVALTLIAIMLAEPGIRSIRDMFRYKGDSHMRPVMEHLDKQVEATDSVFIVGVTAENLYRYYSKFTQFQERSNVSQLSIEPRDREETVSSIVSHNDSERIWLVFSESSQERAPWPDLIREKVEEHWRPVEEYRREHSIAVLFEK